MAFSYVFNFTLFFASLLKLTKSWVGFVTISFNFFLNKTAPWLGFCYIFNFFFCHFMFGNRGKGIQSLSWGFIKDNLIFLSHSIY